MKKLLSIFLALTIFTLCTSPLLATEPSLKEKCSYLSSIGLPKSYIDGLSYEEIESMFYQFYGTNSSLISLDTQYMQEDENTNFSFSVVPYGNISSSVMTFSIATIATTVSNTNQISYLTVYVKWDWSEGRPNIKRTDAIAVNWDSSLFVLKSNSFSSSVWIREGDNAQNWLPVYQISNPDTAVQGGLGVSISLKINPHLLEADGHIGGTVQFSLLPTHTIYNNNTNKVTSINAIYTHDTRIFPGTSFSFDITENSHVSITAPGSSDSVSATTNVFYRE